MDKCFCHFNGYEVKDAKARSLIEEIKKITNANVNGCKVVDSTSKMTDTSIIYILSTDNHYYYYDEEEGLWIVGGLFGSENSDVDFTLEDKMITASHLSDYLRKYINNGYIFEIVKNDVNSVMFKDYIKGGVIKNNLDYTITGGLTDVKTGETEVLYLISGATGNVPVNSEYVLTFTSDKLTEHGVTEEIINEMQNGITYFGDVESDNGIEVIDNLENFLALRKDGLYLIKNSYDGVGSLGMIFSQKLASGTIKYMAYVFTQDDNGQNVPKITSYSTTSNSDVTMMQEDNSIKLAKASLNTYHMYENLITGPMLANFIGQPLATGEELRVDNLNTENKTLVGAINEVLSLIGTGGGSGDGDGGSYVQYINSSSENLVSLIDLESGIYVLNGDFSFNTNLASAKTITFKNVLYFSSGKTGQQDCYVDFDGSNTSNNFYYYANNINKQTWNSSNSYMSFNKKNILVGINDTLTSTSSDYALSAKQGSVLKGYIDNLTGEILFDNVDGTGENITLSKDVSNYSYIEIYFRNDDYKHSSVKLNSANGKVTNLSVNSIHETSMYHKSREVAVVNNTINTHENHILNVEITGGQTTNDTTNKIFITKVVGYK